MPADADPARTWTLWSRDSDGRRVKELRDRRRARAEPMGRALMPQPGTTNPFTWPSRCPNLEAAGEVG